MPSLSVSAQQFAVKNTMEQPDVEFDIPRPGSAANWGSKRYTAWAAQRAGGTPTPGSKETMGSTFNFSEE